MSNFEILSYLHNIPVVRSLTDKLYEMYGKAKDTSVLIRLPCNLAETVADKSLKLALTVANPLVKPLSELAHVVDTYASEKLRQLETKYPAINTPTDEVMHTFNEKTESVRQVVNSVKDTTTSTIQHSKETVCHAATATVDKASNIANSVYLFSEKYVPAVQHLNADKITELRQHAYLTVSSTLNYVLNSIQSSLLWSRMLTVYTFLVKTQ